MSLSLASWIKWWTAVDRLIKKGARLARQNASTVNRKEFKKIIKQLANFQQHTPPKLHIEYLLANIRKAATLDDKKLSNELYLTLKVIPQKQFGILARIALLNYWLIRCDWEDLNLRMFLSVFRSFLAKHPNNTVILHPWQHIIESWELNKSLNIWGLTDAILDEVTDRHLMSVVFESFVEYQQECDVEMSVDDGVLLIQLVNVIKTAKQACEHFFSLKTKGLDQLLLLDGDLKYAYKLDNGSGHFADLITVFTSGKIHRRNILTIDSLLRQAGWGEFVRDLILDRNLKLLNSVGLRLAAVKNLHGQITPPLLKKGTEIPEWCRFYPKEFTSILVDLSNITTDAQHKAENLLEKDFPNPENVQREIHALQDRLFRNPDDDRMAKRLANLQQRLNSSKKCSPKRLAHLQEKLERALRSEVLSAWEEKLNREIHTKISTLLNLNEIPGWLYEPKQLSIIAAVLSLTPAFRKLGLEILRYRCASAENSFIDHPVNQKFIEKIRKLGIDPQSWIVPEKLPGFTLESGQKISLGIETDPLEIFFMGEHFKTCLSLDDINFFAVIANIADVNKHVVFARDESQRVIGRCLIALTDEGGLLTFEPYCHDKSWGFDKIVAQFAEKLAVKMGTVVTMRGKVSCLAAPDWYDDGPRDLCNRFAFLQENSPFRLSLPDMDPKNLVTELEKLFHPLKMNALTLTPVINLPEFDERPVLIFPLLPLLKAVRNPANQTWLRTIYLVHQAGATGVSFQWINKRVISNLLEIYNQTWSIDRGVMMMLIELRPSFALQFLRRTRSRGVRSDEAEEDVDLREYLALAHEALGRSKLAQKLREQSTLD